jgi:hypothetical protein
LAGSLIVKVKRRLPGCEVSAMSGWPGLKLELKTAAFPGDWIGVDW